MHHNVGRSFRLCRSMVSLVLKTLKKYLYGRTKNARRIERMKLELLYSDTGAKPATICCHKLILMSSSVEFILTQILFGRNKVLRVCNNDNV